MLFNTSFNTRTALFGVFLFGLVLSFMYFTFVERFDRSIEINQQLREVEERIALAEAIYQSCVSLSQSGTSAPSLVRSSCVESRSFVLFARGFVFDPKLNTVRQKLLILARTIEEMTDAIATRPTSSAAHELLEMVPEQINALQREINNEKRWWKFLVRY